MPGTRLTSEQYVRYHRRSWQLYLLFCSVMATGTLVAVLIPGQQPKLVAVPLAVVFILMLGLRLVVRSRDAKTHDKELKRIEQDEWIALSRSKSARDAFLAVIFAQGPLMFFMAYVHDVPSAEASVAGMGGMTVAIGCGTYAASFLRRSKPSADE